MRLPPLGNDWLTNIRLAPDDGGGGGGGGGGDGAPSGGDAAQTAAPAVATAPPATTSTATAPSTAPEAPVTQDQWESIRDVAKSHGLPMPEGMDDMASARWLIDQARRNDSYVQYGQQYAQHAAEFQRWQAEQARVAQQQQAPQPKNYFNLPPYDPAWLNQVQRDPVTGNLVPANGAPHDVVHKLNSYLQARRGMEDQFWTSPEKHLAPILQDVIAPMIQQAFQQNFSQVSDRAYAQSFIAQNSDWLHMRDPAGQVISNPISGAPMLSQEGETFRQHLNALQVAGVTNLQVQQEMALAIMERDYYRGQARAQNGSAAAQTQSDAIKQGFLMRGNRRPNVAGSTTPSPNGNQPQPAQNSQLSLADRMRADLAAAGVRDQDIVDSLR